MKELICDRELSRSLIPTIVEVFPVIYPEPKDRVEAVLDIVSELRQPLVEMVAPIRRGPGPCEALTLNQQVEVSSPLRRFFPRYSLRICDLTLVLARLIVKLMYMLKLHI